MSFAFIFLTHSTKKLVAVLRDKRLLAISILISLLVFLPIEFGIAYAEKYVSASLATVIFRTSPLLMLPLLPLMLREKLTKYQIGALTLAVLGIFIGITGGTFNTVFLNASFYAIMFLVVLAFLYALSNVLIKKYLIDMGVILAIASVCLAVLFSTMYLISGHAIGSISVQDLAAIVFLGAFSNVIGYYMYFTGLRILKTTFVTNLILLSPFITFVFANVFLGEAIQPYYVIIALFVAAGILIQKFDVLGGTYLARKKSGARNKFLIFDVSGAFVNTGETAISGAIRSGGRVMAVKLDGKHRDAINDFVKSRNDNTIFIGKKSAIAKEYDFCKEILGAGDSDMIIMKAGDTKDGERFFDSMAQFIDGSGRGKVAK
jgi:drug/metabolite transporter (DMT)-like permease